MRLNTGTPTAHLVLLGCIMAVATFLCGCGEEEVEPITFNIGGETVEPTPLLSYTLEPEAPPTVQPTDG